MARSQEEASEEAWLLNVEISPRAFRDLDELATELKQRSQSNAVARKWFMAVLDSIDSLAEMPERLPVVTEAHNEIERVRLLLHGKRNHRYIGFTTACRKLGPSSGTVNVFHVRHWARKGLSGDELQELMDELPGRARKRRRTMSSPGLVCMLDDYPLVSEIFAFESSQ